MNLRMLGILVALAAGSVAGCGRFQTTRDQLTRKHCWPYVLPEPTPTETGCYVEPAFYGYHGTCWRKWPEGWVGCPIEEIEEIPHDRPTKAAPPPMPAFDDVPPPAPPAPAADDTPPEIPGTGTGTDRTEGSGGDAPRGGTSRRSRQPDGPPRAAFQPPPARDAAFVRRATEIAEGQQASRPPATFQPVSVNRPLLAPVGQIDPATSEILEARRDARSRYAAPTAGPAAPAEAPDRRNLFGPAPGGDALQPVAESNAQKLGEYVRFHSRWAPTHETSAVKALQARMAERAGLGPAPIQPTEVNRFNPNGN